MNLPRPSGNSFNRELRRGTFFNNENISHITTPLRNGIGIVFNPVRKLAASRVLDFVPVMGNDCSEILYKFADVFVVACTPPDSSGPRPARFSTHSKPSLILPANRHRDR